MSQTDDPGSPPGWYPDPAGLSSLRWYDGVAWTDHVYPDPGSSAWAPAWPGGPDETAAGPRTPGPTASAWDPATRSAPGWVPPGTHADSSSAGPVDGGYAPWPSAGLGVGLGQGGPSGPGYPAAAAFPGPPARTNSLSVVSLVTAVLWLCGLGSLIAVVTGHVGLSQIRRSGGSEGGRGLAVAGLIVGYLGLAATVLAGVLFGIGLSMSEELGEFWDESLVQTELSEAADFQEAYRQVEGRYTRDMADLYRRGYVLLDPGAYAQGQEPVIVWAGTEDFCMQGTASTGKTFYQTRTRAGEGQCPETSG